MKRCWNTSKHLIPPEIIRPIPTWIILSSRGVPGVILYRDSRTAAAMAIDPSGDCEEATDWVKQSPTITLIGRTAAATQRGSGWRPEEDSVRWWMIHCVLCTCNFVWQADETASHAAPHANNASCTLESWAPIRQSYQMMCWEVGKEATLTTLWRRLLPVRRPVMWTSLTGGISGHWVDPEPTMDCIKDMDRNVNFTLRYL